MNVARYRKVLSNQYEKWQYVNYENSLTFKGKTSTGNIKEKKTKKNNNYMSTIKPLKVDIECIGKRCRS